LERVSSVRERFVFQHLNFPQMTSGPTCDSLSSSDESEFGAAASTERITDKVYQKWTRVSIWEGNRLINFSGPKGLESGVSNTSPYLPEGCSSSRKVGLYERAKFTTSRCRISKWRCAGEISID
jgi:hypothetical protein